METITMKLANIDQEKGRRQRNNCNYIYSSPVTTFCPKSSLNVMEVAK
jgi:hypothetical protein